MQKQTLKLEIEQLRRSLNVMKHVKDEDDTEILTIIILLENMRGKEGNLEDVEALN